MVLSVFTPYEAMIKFPPPLGNMKHNLLGFSEFISTIFPTITLRLVFLEILS